jgi:hypothetical protein
MKHLLNKLHLSNPNHRPTISQLPGLRLYCVAASPKGRLRIASSTSASGCWLSANPHKVLPKKLIPGI